MATPSGMAPLTLKLTSQIDAVGAGADTVTIIGIVPGAPGTVYTVTGVKYSPVAAITGANTNTRSHNVTDRGADGLGTTNVATLQYNSGVNAVADTPKTITLNVTPANLDVNAGDELTFESTHVGTGIADPGGQVEVTLSRA